MNLRTLTPDDAEQFRTLRLNALQNAPYAFASSYEEEIDNPVDNFRNRLKDPLNTIFGAFDDTRLVGMVGFRREDKLKLRHRAWIWGVYVEPNYRGSGLTRQLMTMAIDHARQFPELVYIYLSVNAANQPARKIYQSLGFEIYGYEKKALFVNGEFQDEEWMALNL